MALTTAVTAYAGGCNPKSFLKKAPY